MIEHLGRDLHYTRAEVSERLSHIESVVEEIHNHIKPKDAVVATIPTNLGAGTR